MKSDLKLGNIKNFNYLYNMKNLDTHTLIDIRDTLKETIFNDFIKNFPQFEDEVDSYDDIESYSFQSWEKTWQSDMDKIDEIDVIEQTLGNEFYHNVSLIHHSEFREYIKAEILECGGIPKLPDFVKIDWDETISSWSSSYFEVVYQDEIYYCK